MSVQSDKAVIKINNYFCIQKILIKKTSDFFLCKIWACKLVIKYNKFTGTSIAKADYKKKMTLNHESVGDEKAFQP